LGSGTPAGFVIGPVDKRFKRRSAPDVERADSLGSVEFVPRHRQQINTESIYIGCDLADGLRGIGMQQGAMLAGDPTYFFNRFDRANFIIGVHDADENGFRRDRAAQIVRIGPTVMIDGEIGHFGAEPLQKLACRDRCRVLDRACDDVIPLVLEREVHALEGEVVRLAAAAREDYLIRGASEESGDLTARILKRGLGRATGPVTT
jgi:hypothetical protein